ncbi:MAG: hypothetical protein OXD42_13250, partial [Rhodospirillaceae bacterium]|nr:hypothetical protein [Rhodospirillaceae bacterium]
MTPPARRLPLPGIGRNNLAVRAGDVPLDDIALVVEPAADKVGEEGARVAARCEGVLHGAVLPG